MSQSSDEKWDKENRIWDLKHGNTQGALWAYDRLRYDELKEPSESTLLVHRAGWKRIRVGNNRFVTKSYPDPQPGVRRVLIRKIEKDPVTKRKLATETVEALPFGFDAIVLKDYAKYGVQKLAKRKDVGRTVLANRVRALSNSTAIRKSMEHLLRGKSR